MEVAKEILLSQISKETLIRSRHSVHSSSVMDGVSKTMMMIFSLIAISLEDSKASEGVLTGGSAEDSEETMMMNFTIFISVISEEVQI